MDNNKHTCDTKDNTTFVCDSCSKTACGECGFDLTAYDGGRTCKACLEEGARQAQAIEDSYSRSAAWREWEQALDLPF